ncbi:uncharacterized protein [Eucyclogobius newberryi]|uniref:uncharacterized protein n=1 Tax=Eucyclogobius newberryi TaxID=166745 RepID=UPI003B5B3C63
MSVCLRFMSDSRSINLFKAPSSLLRLSPNIAGSSQDLFHSFSSNSHSQVTLSPWIPTAQTPPWTSVCLVLDSVNSVLQIFEGGAMRIRKIQPSRMAWSGEPVLDISGLDGQVTDLEVWDYPLKYRQVFSYLQNYMSSGTVLTWSNIVYRFKGKARFEEAFALRRKEPISSSEAQEQPIRSMQGRGQGLKYRKTFDGQRQRRPMF